MEKVFKGYLILNWKTGKIEAKVKGKRNYSPYEIPIKLEIKAVIPERKEYTFKGEIEVPETKVKEMIMEELK